MAAALYQPSLLSPDKTNTSQHSSSCHVDSTCTDTCAGGISTLIVCCFFILIVNSILSQETQGCLIEGNIR